MTGEPNPVVGYWKCPNGGRAMVKQTKKRGRHLYTQCDCCGLNQGTGNARQQRLWDETEFIAGETVVRPSNVRDKPKGAELSEPAAPEAVPASEPQPAAQPKPQATPSEPGPAPVGDFDPNQSEVPTEPGTTKRDVWGKVVAGTVLIVAGVLGAWMN